MNLKTNFYEVCNIAVVKINSNILPGFYFPRNKYLKFLELLNFKLLKIKRWFKKRKKEEKKWCIFRLKKYLSVPEFLADFHTVYAGC